MRVEKNKLNNIRNDIVSILSNCRNYQKEYYFVSNNLFIDWVGMKANYYKSILAIEKLNNERLYMEIDKFLFILDDIIKKYNLYDDLEFSPDFKEVLISNINNIINGYVSLSNKYKSINTDNVASKEKIYMNINDIEKNIESYNSIKNKIDAFDFNVKEAESFIRTKINDYSVTNLEETSKEIRIKGFTESIAFNSTRMMKLKGELSSKYAQLSDEIDSLVMKLDTIMYYYDTSNSAMLVQKINDIKKNLIILNKNFVNNINLLNKEIEEHRIVNSKISGMVEEFRA